MLTSRGASGRVFRSLHYSDAIQLRSVGSVANIASVNSTSTVRTRERWRLKATIPRTHILTFPMYQNAEAWARLSEFRERLLECGPDPHLERNIVVPWINEALEFKLGNIVIKDSNSSDNKTDDTGPSFRSFEYHHVMDVLQGLKSPIKELLRTHGYDKGVLPVPLGHVLPLWNDSKKYDPTQVHVLLLTPEETKEAETLRAVSRGLYLYINEVFLMARLVFNTFKNAGMLNAPPAVAPFLSTTLINTKNRACHKNLPAAQRPKSQKRRPINLEALYASQSFKKFLRGDTSDSQLPSHLQQPVSLDLGTAEFTCVCIRRVVMPAETRELVHDGMIDLMG